MQKYVPTMWEENEVQIKINQSSLNSNALKNPIAPQSSIKVEICPKLPALTVPSNPHCCFRGRFPNDRLSRRKSIFFRTYFSIILALIWIMVNENEIKMQVIFSTMGQKFEFLTKNFYSQKFFLSLFWLNSVSFFTFLLIYWPKFIRNVLE
jgi:hypothetical protein